MVFSKYEVKRYFLKANFSRILFFQIDESGEIRASAFDDVCDKMYNSLEVGKVYAFTNAIVRHVLSEYSLN